MKKDHFALVHFLLLLLLTLGMTACRSERSAQTVEPAAMVPQFPSPMAESARHHGRLEATDAMVVERLPEGAFPGRVERIVSGGSQGPGEGGLLLHFHGPAYIPSLAVTSLILPMQAVTINLGSGSSAYERPFQTEVGFSALIDTLVQRSWLRRGDWPRIYLSAFSAGYGAVRAILREHADQIDGILLLDGMQASYVPEGTVLSAGGTINSLDLEPFIDFAARAVNGDKQMVVTHSEIFPGTYASTTETTDYLLSRLGLDRTPVLVWGPVGMQQVSEAARGRLAVLGFAGNKAPDHVDHLHGLPEFLKVLLNE